jgi:hypothetical protein
VQTYSVGSAPVGVDLGDVDGDDDIDITVAAFSSANCTVLRNLGGGIFGSSFALSAQTAASCAVIVDYDRDGDTDVVVTDELEDKAFLYRQTGPNPPGVQPPSCNAALRINSHAGRAGFGGAQPRPLLGGTTVFVNVSGAPAVPFLLALGTPQVPGTAASAGLVNLLLSPLPAVLVDGFAGHPAGVTDSAGEAWLGYLLPASLPTGLMLALQGIVLAPTTGAGASTTNPETVIFQ